MAKYQYRVAGTYDWMSNSGNALISIYNPPGSGKKITVRSLEFTNITTTDTGTAGTASAGLARSLSIARATVAGGDVVVPVPMDSSAGAWPSSVRLATNSTVASAGAPLSTLPLLKQMNQNSLSWMAMPQNIGTRWTGLRRGPRRGTTSPVTSIVIKAGEAAALYTRTGVQGVPLRVSATLVRTGTPNRTYTLTFFTTAGPNDTALFSIDNTAGSGETVTLTEVSVEEVGTYDSPYMQVVPMGPVDVTAYEDASKRVSPMPMDTSYPDPASWVRVMTDVPFLPLGLPENALSDGGAGSPKGFNYLKSKDFLGPVYRTYFPEFVGPDLRAVLPDSLGHMTSHRGVDLLMRNAGVVLREGEGIAVVSGAETAVVAFAVGMSGWSSWHFGAQIDVEPSFSPTLSLTGLRTGSEVAIYEAGTTTLLASAENVVSGSFSWVFDPTEVPEVDISVLSLGYQNIRLLGQTLTLSDITIPIQQAVDRQYGNP
jgi:hypothetical protein